MKRALVSAVIVVIVDQLTKWWAVSRLPGEPANTIELLWGAKLQLHYNTGAAFSSGTGLGPLIGLVAIVMTGLLLRLAHKRSDKFGQITLGVITGGAVGNLIDRVFRAEDGLLSGAVIDFLRPLDFFAIFNVADAAIVVGVIAILAQSLFFPQPDPSEAAADSDELDQFDEPDQSDELDPSDEVSDLSVPSGGHHGGL